MILFISFMPLSNRNPSRKQPRPCQKAAKSFHFQILKCSAEFECRMRLVRQPKGLMKYECVAKGVSNCAWAAFLTWNNKRIEWKIDIYEREKIIEMQKGAQEKRQLFSISIKGNLKTENYFNNKGGAGKLFKQDSISNVHWFIFFAQKCNNLRSSF